MLLDGIRNIDVKVLKFQYVFRRSACQICRNGKRICTRVLLNDAAWDHIPLNLRGMFKKTHTVLFVLNVCVQA